MYSEAILKTIAYFDVFEYPVTLIELHNFLFDKNQVSLHFLQVNVNKLIRKGVINQNEGFYFFPGKEVNVNKRKERFNNAEEKYRIALKGMNIIKYVPFLKFVAVCNNLSNNNVKEDSDIDLFIVAKKNRLYFVRFFVTVILSLRRLRRNKNKINNRLCLSFYVTDQNLNLSKIKIIDNDFYLMFWIANLYPIFNENYITNVYECNSWITDELGNLKHKSPSCRRRSKYNKKVSNFLSNTLDNKIGDYIENVVKKIQLKKMNLNTQSFQNANDSRVIVNDNMLKFHENDRREYYYNLYLNNLTSVKEEYAKN